MLEASAIAAEIAGVVSSATILRRDEPMARHTTLRVGGPADVFVEPATAADLAAVLRFCTQHAVPCFILGRGSNLLVRDAGVRGVVLRLSQPEFSRIEVDGVRLRCGAGARLKNIAVEARRNGLGGLEFLEGIPGSLGGALRMNAGAMGGATFDAVESVRVMDFAGAVRDLAPDAMAVAYRGCATLKCCLALGAVLRGSPDSVAAIAQRMTAYSQKRWASQPAAPSAGCMFKNPAAIPAGKLIDELGLKGARVGGARVSQEHGNFLVNDGQATAADVLELIRQLQARARAARGIELETEVEIIGE
jgi:UDP-N-acetylenolpyruvoylglucosamine reductase